jgi:hypothetical protein
MSIIHAVRSDNSSFNARYSWGGKTPGQILQASAVGPALYESDAGAIGGNRINMDRSAAIARNMYWNSMLIQPQSTSRAISVLARVKLGANGVALGIWTRDGNLMNWGANRLTLWVNASNQWQCFAANENGQTAINSVTFGTQNVGTTNYVDVLFTWDGTTTANAVKLYIDGVLLGSATATAALNSTFDWRVCGMLGMGGNSSANNCRMHWNEFVVLDTAIADPTAVALTSGTGSLNGVSRTAFMDVASFDGLSSTDPGIANVRNATAYVINGVDKTGSLVVPSLANTKTGVAGDGGVGTYDGSDRWSDPLVANVRLGTTYKANSTSNNKTGLLELPDRDDVRVGIVFDNDDKIGRLVLPDVEDVRTGIGYGTSSTEVTGELDLPVPSNVKTGVSYDSASLVGTYTGADRWTDPGIANVLSPTAYKANSTTNNRVGTYVASTSLDPGEANVRLGTAYEINDVALVGTMLAPTVPLAGPSALSTAYNALVARISDALAAVDPDGWLQIPNAYEVKSNAKGFLRQGFGIAIGVGTNAHLQLCNTLTVDRRVQIVISREVFKLDGDAAGYGDVAKQLFEDLKLIITDLETSPTLNNGITFAGYESDSGIKPIESDDFSGMYLEAEFKIQMFENLNS